MDLNLDPFFLFLSLKHQYSEKAENTMNQPAQTKPHEEPLHKYGEAKVRSSVITHYGIDTSHFNSISWIADDTILLGSGKFALFINVLTGSIESQDGPKFGGVGITAVHPSRQFYVIGERAPKNPGACIYSWPDKQLVHRFEGGASIGYCACCFDAEGTRMATVGSFPDFTLVVWDWETRSMILRCKCFGSDVSTVRFSEYDNSLLVTGGNGHIKFWSMAKTFTGLKLQGTLGKFGRLEISNVTGFVVLPDGKVISGSESGSLLLWEGDLVKCSFVREIFKAEEDMGAFQQKAYDCTPCHVGPINCVIVIHDGRVVVTAGDDGYIRYWSREELDVAEGDGIPPMYAPKCLLEMCVSTSFHIRSITYCESRGVWVVLDSQGVIATSPFPTSEEVFSGIAPSKPALPPIHFNGGGITCSTISAHDHRVVTGGEDGVIRLVDYVKGSEVYHLRFAPLASKPNCVTFVRFFRKHGSSKILIAGYDDGTVQLVRRGKDAFTVLESWKPHSDGLFTIAMEENEVRFATVSKNGTVFFFNINEGGESLQPIGFCKAPMINPLSAEWDAEETGCFLGYESGEVISIVAPGVDDVDRSRSFEFPCTYSLIGVRQRKLPPPRDENEVPGDEDEDLLEEKDNGPWAVVFIKRLLNGKYAVGMRKEELVYEYDMRIRYPKQLALPPLPPTGVEPPDYVEEPGENLCYRNLVPCAAFLCKERNEFLVVCENANIILRGLSNQTTELVGQAHDCTNSRITGCFSSFDGSMVVTTGLDGLVVTLLREGGPSAPPQTSPPKPPLVSLFAEEEMPPRPALSIQEQKEADDLAKENAEKQRRLDLFLGKVRVIHDKLKAVMTGNAELPTPLQLTCDELDIDPTLHQRLEDEKLRRIEEARKPFLLDTTREDIRIQKLRRRFVDNLIYDRFLVRSFDDEFFVASFRTLNPAEGIAFLRSGIKELEGTESECDEEGQDDGPASDGHETEAASEREEEKAKEELYGSVHMSASVRQQLDKLDERRRERQERRVGYERILTLRPDPMEDSRELNRLREADIAARGECVLRTNPKYKGRPGFAPTATAKLERTIFLIEYLVDQRTKFNKSLLDIRDVKEEKMRVINAIRQRIAAINDELNDNSVEASPLSLRPDEKPEKRYDADREGLDAFAKEREQERLREEMAKKAQRGFGADLAGAGSISGAGGSSSFVPRESGIGQSFSREQGQSIFINVANRERLDAELRSKLENIKLSEMEEEEREMRKAQLTAERERLLCESRSIATQFDRDLKALVFERANVDADICLGESRLLLLFREYQLLLVFRKRDKELVKKLRLTKQSREKFKKQIDVHKADIVKKGVVIDAISERLRQAHQEAEAYLHENCPPDKLPYILKVYHRQIKHKKNANDEDDNDDITSDDDEDYEVDDDIGEEICPNNCDFAVWEEMLKLREIRLVINDEYLDAKELQDNAQKEKVNCETKVEELAQQLKACETEKELLEAEKRKELNMLNAVVSLQCHQVKSLTEEGMCPEDLHKNPVLVISDEELMRLRRRVSELALEKKGRREEISSMSAEHQHLQDDKASTQRIHDEWDERVHEVMMLKFGQRVDLELLESCGTSRRIEAKKEELRSTEMKWEREIRRHEKKIVTLRDRLQSTLIGNTHLLQDFSAYEGERQMLDKELSEATTKTIQRYRGACVATAADRANLRNLITAQQREMDALNAEIIMLRRKGGHAYSA